SGSGNHGDATLDIGETWTYTLTYDVTTSDITREQTPFTDDLNIHNDTNVTAHWSSNGKSGGVSDSSFADVPVASGSIQYGTISGTKIVDADGVLSPNDADQTPYLGGWTIYLDDNTDPTDGTIATSTTNQFGEYTFSNLLLPATYYVYEETKTGW